MPRDWDEIKPSQSWDTRQYASKFQNKGARYVRTLFNSIFTDIEKEPYTHKLRVSKLPTCVLLDAIERIEQPEFEKPYSMDFYTAIGTALHETIQNACARSPKYGHIMFGDWKCEERTCGHMLRFRLRPDSLVCPKCSAGKLKYSELELVDGAISGHMDLLTLDARGQYVAYDFKTSNENAVLNPRYLPYQKHRVQIETYCAMLWRLHKIRVKMYAIVYISRNKTQNLADVESSEQFTPCVETVVPSVVQAS